jgi:hypothetical protein
VELVAGYLDGSSRAKLRQLLSKRFFNTAPARLFGVFAVFPRYQERLKPLLSGVLDLERLLVG